MLAPASEEYAGLIPAQERRAAGLRREGVVRSSFGGAQAAPDLWREFLVVRPSGREQVRAHLASLPLAHYLDFESTELSVT